MGLYVDNRTTTSVDDKYNQDMINQYRIDNEPGYREQVNRQNYEQQMLASQSLQDTSLDIAGLGLGARAVGLGGNSINAGKKFSPEVAAKYNTMYDDSAKYAQANAIYWPKTQRHYDDVVGKYTSDDGIAMVDKYHQKFNPEYSLDGKMQMIKELPASEGLGGLTKRDVQMMSKTDQELWTGLQTRRNWKLD